MDNDSQQAARTTRGVVAYADLGRFGLGHSLLAWARSFVWSAERGVPMLVPSWPILRIGPYLRSEKDKRRYQRLFSYQGYIGGMRKQLYLRLGTMILAEAFAGQTPKTRPLVVVFRNDASNNTRFFRELKSHHKLVHHELRRITRPAHRPAESKHPFIAIHVRRGDFSKSSVDEIKLGEGNARLPLGWYLQILRGLRQHLPLMPALVFSDGSLEELRPLLAEPGVQLAQEKSALHALLLMAQSSVIIGSGSGLTMWGAFAGQVPRVSFPGQRKERLLDSSSVEVEPEWEFANEVTPQFCAAVIARTAGAGERTA